MPITQELLDQLLNEYEKPEDLLGDQGILQQLTKALVERALEGELTHHLGYKKHEAAGAGSGNSRNGTTPKTIKSKCGQTLVEVPRDRNGTFEPQLIRKNQMRFDGFDEKIISLYARGMTTREIQEHLQEIYGIEISPALVSSTTEAVLAEVRTWQSRPLDAVYPILYLDALMVKVKENGRVINKAVYLVIGVNLQGLKEVLGIWISDSEGAKFWLSIVTELQTRGVQDVFIACVDGLKDFPEAIEAVFPKTQVQLCLVHLLRHSLSYVSYKEREEVAADLKLIYQVSTLKAAETRLLEFSEKWESRYPVVARTWSANWARIVPMFAFTPEIRRAIYTTNVIESLNFSLRKIIKSRAFFQMMKRCRKFSIWHCETLRKNGQCRYRTEEQR